MIHSDTERSVEKSYDQDLITKNCKKSHHLYKNMQILKKKLKKGNKKVVDQYPNIPLMLVRILKKKTI